MLFGARAFVFLVYALLGLSFLAGPALLFTEFGPDLGLLIATHDSHLFLFFPTLGLVALAAFYVPSCAFVDLYWRHLRFGKLRFLLGLFALAGISYAIGTGLTASPYKSLWDVSPELLAADKGEPAGCGGAKPCDRIALLEGLANVARVSHGRLGLKDLVRNCQAEPLIEPLAERELKRYCFASTAYSDAPRLSSDAECCAAQRRFQSAIKTLYDKPEGASLTGRVQALLLPLKVFFLLVLLGISFLLVLRHGGVVRHYPEHVDRIEVSVLVGAITMLFFPLMSQGFVQTADVLYGVQQDAGFRPIVTLMTFLFGAWALLIVLFFFRRHDTEMELAAKLAGVAASTIAVVKFDLIVALAVRYLGSGAGELSVILLVALSAAAIVVLCSTTVRRLIAGEGAAGKG